jgi:N-acyl homoserine lactone hydrolase
MSVHAQAKPLSEPFAGGSEGSTVAVEPLIVGSVSWPMPMMEAPGGAFEKPKLLAALLTGKPETRVPCPAFLIRHPSAGPILVDTGLHPSVASDPSQNFGGLATRVAKPQLGAGEDLHAQLRQRGVDPGDVKTVVMTHLHFDHSSGLSEFPDATFVLSAAEWTEATTGSRPLLNGYRRAHYDFAFDYRTIDFDAENIDSYASFGRTFDLLGDGSIRLAYTPGHSAGHLSVIARLGQRDFVIGGDLIYTIRQLEPGSPLPPRPFDGHNYRRSLQELRHFHTMYPHAVITPGHDPGFYPQLEASYS